MANTFQKGSGAYKCQCCGKATRETGEGESWVNLCARCNGEGLMENSISDGQQTCLCGNEKEFTLDFEARHLVCQVCGATGDRGFEASFSEAEFLVVGKTKIASSSNEEELFTAGAWIRDQPFDHEVKVELIDLFTERLEQLRSFKEGKEEPTHIFKLRRWIAKERGVPRELEGTIEAETARAYLVKARCANTPTSTCRACGRALTHPVSVLYGIGPECGGHYHIPKDGDLEMIRELVSQITFEGWLPKSQVEVRRV